jgi:hypothetical protein
MVLDFGRVLYLTGLDLDTDSDAEEPPRAAPGFCSATGTSTQAQNAVDLEWTFITGCCTADASGTA